MAVDTRCDNDAALFLGDEDAHWTRDLRSSAGSQTRTEALVYLLKGGMGLTRPRYTSTSMPWEEVIRDGVATRSEVVALVGATAWPPPRAADRLWPWRRGGGSACAGSIASHPACERAWQLQCASLKMLKRGCFSSLSST